MIKGIIFDYGGTIDSRGVHWSEIIWDGYQLAKIPVTKEQFRECYVAAERELARTRHILPHHNFHDLLLIKMRLELEQLISTDCLSASFDLDATAATIAQYCYDQARITIEEVRPVIESLHKKFPLVLVSNFYGNIQSVLADFDLLRYFNHIIESAVVGIRKPNPQIFQRGIDALGLKAEEVLVVGDSYKKDILPAESLGCKVLWLKGKGWTDEENDISHPKIITSLSEIGLA